MPDVVDLLALVFRWLHVLAAATTVGGAVFIRLVLLPAQSVLPKEQIADLHVALRRRWSKIVAAAIGFLLVSGIYNFSLNTLRYDLPKWYQAVFGIKFLLAMGVFMIASLLAGKTAAADKLRQNTRFWLNLNLAMAVGIICLSGVLRTADKRPKTPKPAPTQADDRQPPRVAEIFCSQTWV